MAVSVKVVIAILVFTILERNVPIVFSAPLPEVAISQLKKGAWVMQQILNTVSQHVLKYMYASMRLLIIYLQTPSLDHNVSAALIESVESVCLLLEATSSIEPDEGDAFKAVQAVARAIRINTCELVS